ncbi:MAG: hypothetical protein QM775_27890 [Pirellulales bacterium]
MPLCNFDDFKKLWNHDTTKGLERLFDTALLLFRRISLSYLLKRSTEGEWEKLRTPLVDAYCVLQFVVLGGLLMWGGGICSIVVTCYVLFEIYLNLFNIVFIGKFSAINGPPKSIERSILLLLLNVLQVTMAFAVFYKYTCSLSVLEAFFSSSLVLGTVGYPADIKGYSKLLVSLQIFMDVVLLVLLLSAFVGQISLFRNGNSTTKNDVV